MGICRIITLMKHRLLNGLRWDVHIWLEIVWSQELGAAVKVKRSGEPKQPKGSSAQRKKTKVQVESPSCIE